MSDTAVRAVPYMGDPGTRTSINSLHSTHHFEHAVFARPDERLFSFVRKQPVSYDFMTGDGWVGWWDGWVGWFVGWLCI